MLTPTTAEALIREEDQTKAEGRAEARVDAEPDAVDVEPRVPAAEVDEAPLFAISPTFRPNAGLQLVNTSIPLYPTIAAHRASPLGPDLLLRTDVWGPDQDQKLTTVLRASAEKDHGAGTTGIPIRTPSVRSTLSASQYSLSPSSALSSPAMGPLSDMTALPSPIDFTASPGPWFQASSTPFTSPRTSIDGKASDAVDSDLSSASRGSPRKRKAYPSLTQTPEKQVAASQTTSSHHRNRSQSEYAPTIQIPRRQVAVSGSQTPTRVEALPALPLHREEYLAIQRGITVWQHGDPTTPRSHLDVTKEEGADGAGALDVRFGALPTTYEAKMIKSGKSRRWTAIRQLGKGTFSTVFLARGGTTLNMGDEPLSEEKLDSRYLVAVKICDQGPAGGADEKKIESSLKRELEILKAIHHPSLVHLRAVSVHNKQAFLVLNYSPGGDLFELASLQLDLLVPSLVRRMFAELVSAVHYLHGKRIVHRDIKLENVLVNVRRHELPLVSDWQTYPRAVVTLTDLGLGRWLPQPPESPTLHTRCGSEDYAAPELLMGQGYDGRATDAWALGVLLYAIMEGRLPFDPIPGSRKKSPTSHRIARCEWRWVRYADEDGEWDPVKGKELEGGRECVEGLLARARSRFGLEKLESLAWVKGGETVEGGLSIEEEDENE